MTSGVVGRMGHAARGPRFRSIGFEIALVATAAFLYSLVRGLTSDRVELAYANAERVIDFQRSLGFFVEPEIQQAIVSHRGLVDAVNAVYIGGYWPVLIGTLVWLLLRHPAHYPLFRTALLASGAITLVIFAAFPLAPPRFLPQHGFVDTVSEHSAAYRDFSASPLVNEYAAMPSLHFGWILLMGIAWATVGRRALARVFGVAMPILMFIAIVMTGNHYIVDGIVGGIVVLAGLAVAWWIEQRRASPNDPDPIGPDHDAPSDLPLAAAGSITAPTPRRGHLTMATPRMGPPGQEDEVDGPESSSR